AATIMRGGARPQVRSVPADTVLVEQGAEGAELHLVQDGMLSVEIGGNPVAEVGPGAVLGERAILEGGVRTAILRAITPVRVAVATADQLGPRALAQPRRAPPPRTEPRRRRSAFLIRGTRNA